MYSGSPSSLIDVENWAESATIAKPQISAHDVASQGWSMVSPMTAAQAPLTSMLTIVVRVRPHVSARRPAAKLPIPPTARTPNVTKAERRPASGPTFGPAF